MRKWPLTAWVSLGSLVLDQLTKLAIWEWLRPIGRMEVIPGFFHLTFSMNTGVAFGFLGGGSHWLKILFLAAVSLAAVVLILYFIRGIPSRDRIMIWAFSLIIGGALGNAIDRVRLGAVIDFLDFDLGFIRWATFNVADIGLTVGIALVCLQIIRTKNLDWMNIPNKPAG